MNDHEDRIDFADEWAADARRAERCMYRECESFGCGNEAEWKDDEDGSWWCSEHTR